MEKSCLERIYQVLQKTGIMKAAKKAGVDRKIKEKVAKNLK